MTPSEILSTYPNVEGYVYLLLHDNLYKIGSSKYPLQRIRQVAPDDAKLIHLIASNNHLQIEFALHRRFHDKHVRGEWFSLDASDVVLIQSVSIASCIADVPLALRPLPHVKHPCKSSKMLSQAFQARIPDDLYNAFVRLVSAHERTKNQEVIIAVREYCIKHGTLKVPSNSHQ